HRQQVYRESGASSIGSALSAGAPLQRAQGRATDEGRLDKVAQEQGNHGPGAGTGRRAQRPLLRFLAQRGIKGSVATPPFRQFLLVVLRIVRSRRWIVLIEWMRPLPVRALSRLLRRDEVGYAIAHPNLVAHPKRDLRRSAARL